MSGAHRQWTPEQRAAAAERIRMRNSDPEFAAKRTAWMHDPDRKEELRERGKRVAHVRTNDVTVQGTWRVSLYRAANKPEKRRRSAEVMKLLMSRPEMRIQASHNGKTVDHSAIARKGWLTRRRKKIEAAIARRNRETLRASP